MKYKIIDKLHAEDIAKLAVCLTGIEGEVTNDYYLLPTPLKFLLSSRMFCF